HIFEGGPAPDILVLGNSSLIQTSDGTLWGTTQHEGQGQGGTVFKWDESAGFSTVHSFTFDDGEDPAAALVLGTDGNLYGTTRLGGMSGPPACPLYGCGTVFKMDPSGGLTTLHEFNGYLDRDGLQPLAALIQAVDGSFYGTTSAVYGSNGMAFK